MLFPGNLHNWPFLTNFIFLYLEIVFKVVPYWSHLLFLGVFLVYSKCVCMLVCSTRSKFLRWGAPTMGCSPPGSSVHGVFQARMLEWVAISNSKVWNLHDSCVSCTGRWILHHCATWEAHIGSIHALKNLFAFLLINLSFITGESQPPQFSLRGLSCLSFSFLCEWNTPFQLRDTSPRPQENG